MQSIQQTRAKEKEMRDEEERMREFSHHNATLKHHAPTPSVGSTATSSNGDSDRGVAGEPDEARVCATVEEATEEPLPVAVPEAVAL